MYIDIRCTHTFLLIFYNNIDVHPDADANDGVGDDAAAGDGDNAGHRLKSTKCTFTPDTKIVRRPSLLPEIRCAKAGPQNRGESRNRDQKVGKLTT